MGATQQRLRVWRQVGRGAMVVGGERMFERGQRVGTERQPQLAHAFGLVA